MCRYMRWENACVSLVQACACVSTTAKDGRASEYGIQVVYGIQVKNV